MKAVIFARVSSKDQEDGHSLDAQIQSCFKYAIDKNFSVVEQFRIVESSTAIGRPEFSKMVNYVKAQKDKIIVLCYCIDRLQRDFDEQYIELQRLIKQDRIEIHYIKNEFIEHRDMDSSEKFRKNLDVLLANDYRNKISDNVKRSARKKLEEGTILGDSPLGYLNSRRVDKKKEKVEVTIDSVRGGLIKKMFEEYATGLYSMDEIRLRLTDEGLRSKKGCKISKSQVEKILQNPFYYGYMQYNGLLYKHIHPTLISKELFDECQRVRTGKRKMKSKRTDAEYEHQIQESNKLQKQYQTIQTRIKRARELFLDAQISKEEYDEIITGLQVERHNVEVRLQKLTEADDGFNKSLSTIFALASKAHDLFKSSELEEKRRIITILFPNLEMSAEKLVFKPRKPFDVFLNLPHRPNWLPGTGSNRRPND